MRASRAGWLAEGQRCAIPVSFSPKSALRRAQRGESFRSAQADRPTASGPDPESETGDRHWVAGRPTLLASRDLCGNA
eukprot:3369281-Prymnesium_polylepis.2